MERETSNDIKSAQNASQPPDGISSELEEPAVTRIELIDITEKEKKYGEQPVITITSPFHTAKEDRGRYSDFAMLIRRKIDKEGDSVSTEVEIRSPIIRKALQGILATYAFLNLAATPIVIAKPYSALFHHREDIRNYAISPERSPEEKRHLAVLTDFLAKYIGPAEKMYQQMNLKGMIRFDLLWTLFRAEDDVISQAEHFKEVYRVVHCEQKTKEDETFFLIQVWRWGYSAGKFGPVQETLMIPEFSSTRRITQLPIFPFRCLSEDNQRAIYSEVVERGRQWRNLIHASYRQYNGMCHVYHKHLLLKSYIGPIWVDPPSDKAETMQKLIVQFVRLKINIYIRYRVLIFSQQDGRIMLDHKLHTESNFYLTDKLIGANGFTFADDSSLDRINRYYHAIRFGSFGRPGDVASRQGPSKRYILNNVQCHHDDEHYEMTDEEAWLCPARVRGFSLSTKKWAFFLVEKVRSVDFKEDAFCLLEMEPLLKDTVRALVEMHGTEMPQFDDFIAGKGKGIIMSLEGPPGAGKTLTAGESTG
jgi:hypothetical protein